MPGQYTVEMLALKYGVTSDSVRRALQTEGVYINLSDMVDVDAAEAVDKQMKKFFAEEDKAQQAHVKAHASWEEARAKELADYNKKVESELEKGGGWEALATKGKTT